MEVLQLQMQTLRDSALIRSSLLYQQSTEEWRHLVEADYAVESFDNDDDGDEVEFMAKHYHSIDEDRRLSNSINVVRKVKDDVALSHGHDSSSNSSSRNTKDQRRRASSSSVSASICTSTRSVETEEHGGSRWFCLASLAFQYFSGYFAYDVVSISSMSLKKHLHFSNDTLGTMFALYSVPNMIMPLIGGIMGARIGVHASILTFALIVLVGTVASLAGPYYCSVSFLLLGRFILGLGAEALYINMETQLSERFQDKEISFAYAVIFSAAQLGSLCSFVLCPIIEELAGSCLVNFALSCGLTAMALVFNVAFYLVDTSHASLTGEGGSQEAVPILAPGNHFAGTASSSLSLSSHATITRTRGNNISTSANANAAATAIVNTLTKWCAFLQRGASADFWAVFVLIVLFCVTVFPFQEYAPDMFQSSLGLTEAASGRLAASLNGIAIFLGPAMGLYIDRHGGRSRVIVAGWVAVTFCLLFLAAQAAAAHDLGLWAYLTGAGGDDSRRATAMHGSVSIAGGASPSSSSSLASSSSSPSSPPSLAGLLMAMTGLSMATSALQTVLWPILPLLCPSPQIFAQTYGLLFCVMNCGQVVVFTAAGSLSVGDGAYGTVLLMFLAIWVLGSGATCMLVGRTSADIEKMNEPSEMYRDMLHTRGSAEPTAVGEGEEEQGGSRDTYGTGNGGGGGDKQRE